MRVMTSSLKVEQVAFSRGTEFIYSHRKEAQDMGTDAGGACLWELSSDSFYSVKQEARPRTENGNGWWVGIWGLRIEEKVWNVTWENGRIKRSGKYSTIASSIKSLLQVYDHYFNVGSLMIKWLSQSVRVVREWGAHVIWHKWIYGE